MGIAAMFLALFAVPSTVEAQGSSEVYVNYISGATSSTGNGTMQSPYNLFNDAVKNVQNGGTIYILSNGGFINDINSNDAPFVIDKQICIKPASGITKATLNSRAGGIILGADVTFENIELNVANPIHSQIFANGHHLTLKNVTYASGTRLVDLVAGSLYSSQGQSAAGATPGTHGQITIEGRSSQFGNIYAGSVNGHFNGNTTITIQDIYSSSVGEIYACGAAGTGSSALIPNADLYTVSGKVSVLLDKAPVNIIDGSGANSTEISFSTEYLASGSLYTNIDKITVAKGQFQPSQLSAPSNRELSIAISTNGTLDLTKVGNLTAENFWGGGTLILGQNSLLTITGEITGTTSFAATKKNYDGTSGIVTKDHVYIKTPPNSAGTFIFDPYPTQTNLVLQKQANGDWMIVEPSDTSTVTFTYESADDFMGDVDRSTETIDSISGTPEGSEAIPYDGYHFVNWTKDGVVVSTDAYLIPQKSGTAYTGGHYIAHFAQGDKPELEQPETPNPEQPDPDDSNSGGTTPETPVTPAPPAPKPPAPAVSSPKPVNVSLSRPKVTLKKGKKYAVIKYKKVKDAHGYEIYRSTKKKSGYKKVTTTKKTSYKNKKLKSRKKYYYKVRAYRTVNGKKYYSSYSTVKSVKVK